MWISIDTESESKRTPSSGTATTFLVLITPGSSQHHAKTGNSDNTVATCFNFLSFGCESQNHGQQHRLPILEGVIKYKIMKLLQIRFVTMKTGVM